jgi:Raf kinase inhibitor-like YbhB/YbcL family protein
MNVRIIGLALVVFLASYTVPGRTDILGTPELELHSPSFRPYGMIPAKYTCDGEDISPELWWAWVPRDTKSFVLMCEDVDSPKASRVNWVYYDLPAAVMYLPERVARVTRPALGGVHGKNGSGELGYRGPCQQTGTHRYYFRLYALDVMLGLEPGASWQDVEGAMEGHVLDEASLMGMYKKRK